MQTAVGGNSARSTHSVSKDLCGRGLDSMNDGDMQTAMVFSARGSHKEGTWHHHGLQKHLTQNTW